MHLNKNIHRCEYFTKDGNKEEEKETERGREQRRLRH